MRPGRSGPREAGEEGGMPLSEELLQLAANIYRRFPEEFVALGAPELQESFDPDEALHCVVENQLGKSVVVRVPRRRRPGVADIAGHAFGGPLAPSAPGPISATDGWEPPRSHLHRYIMIIVIIVIMMI